jgi:hypothetical protein
VAVSHRSSVYFYSGLTGERISRIDNVHTDNITAMVRIEAGANLIILKIRNMAKNIGNFMLKSMVCI